MKITNINSLSNKQINHQVINELIELKYILKRLISNVFKLNI